MTIRSEIAGLLAIKEDQDRYQWRSDPERTEARQRWMVEAIEVLLRHALGQKEK